MRLLVVLVVVLVALALASWRWPNRVRSLVLVCRHIPITVFDLVRWRGLAAHCGLGSWHISKRSGRRRTRHTPMVTRWHPTSTGLSFRMILRRGDSLKDVQARIPELSTGLRGVVRLAPLPAKPWLVTVSVMCRDPFAKRVAPPVALSATRLQVGVTETGQPFVLNYRERPHSLISGATNSGKSGGIAAHLFALSSTDAVIAMIDLKHGISAAPMRPRASVIAETRAQAAQLLADVLVIGNVRAALVKAHGVENVYELPLAVRPPEVWVFVDEAAEISSGPKGPEKDAGVEASASLLSGVQLLRALGVHIIISAQRFAASQGPSVTNIRAQLGGRICFRSNDIETSNMALGDVSSDAAFASLEIPADRPGVAVSNTGVNRWEVVRFSKIAHADLGPVALANADKRIDWSAVMAETKPLTVVPNPPISADYRSSAVKDETQDVSTGEPAA